jgi:hypothetical protein
LTSVVEIVSELSFPIYPNVFPSQVVTFEISPPQQWPNFGIESQHHFQCPLMCCFLLLPTFSLMSRFSLLWILYVVTILSHEDKNEHIDLYLSKDPCHSFKTWI